MEVISNIVKVVNGFLWDFALLFLLCGTGIYFTVRLRFVQVRKFKEGMKAVFGNIKLRGDKANEDGMSSFQSLATAVAAQVGTGNIAGAATAIASGGPGAILWMWLSAFFGMATIYSEATLAQQFKTRVDGEITGGPVYYIKAKFKGKFGTFLAGFFSVAIILALGFMGNMVQSNSIGDAFKTAFGVNPLIVGIFVAAVAAFIFIGGAKRIASVTEKIVPIMAVLYVLGSLIVLIFNWRNVGNAFVQIFVLAFNPQAMAGGVVGATVQKALSLGVARGLFSNEAGMGSTPHAHAMAKVKHPCEQGVVAMIGVFIDTFIVLTMTALVIITTGALSSGKTGSALAQNAFNSVFGSAGNIFIAICMLFFAFSTIIGWYFFGEVNVKYLFGKKAVKFYSLLVVVFVILGSLMKVDLVWSMSDMFNALMVIPNLIGVLALSGLVVKLNKRYENGNLEPLDLDLK
ncbi:AGCS family alanine or glycine:cation symporter [Hydrogenoanaerobacterium saccharovorans]|uniref:Alanine or glycine:cation symporter, AGCS family n=1 Tax=Hydrogenoanaerobacterium saccharovorans TaxID=474960 RepID=A0A1H8B9Q1_9FIRM|nr:sodium:alanine symporter family protein [Hydrogenoanaerobacterium saccharovorans]RPF47532.1 AGCS family alanine or glycine:cation symporter [Hydrogenoanaerobacterium saccharovorans]SEM79139.1 alanine or glycine:cation symporter, AGCS family [Hydrogenoanaerobacterium saccharovorans]